jgi:PAS domain S-box-containing protein
MKGFGLDVLEPAFEESSEGLAIADEDRILYANQALATVFGYSEPSEMCGKSLASFRPESYCGCRMGSPGQKSRGGREVCEFAGRRKDGSSIQVEARCSSFRAQDRELVVLMVRDVSRRERPRVMRDSDRRFQIMFEAAPIGIVQSTPEGRILEANPAAQHMLGYGLEELRGARFSEFIHPEDRPKDPDLFAELTSGKRETYEHEVRVLRKDSGPGFVHLKVSPVRGFDGEPQFALVMIEDITERKRSEQRLREAQKMEVVGRLVGGVAHDFNNLLTGIMLYCDLLRAGLDPDSNLRHHAEEIRMAGEQGAALIQQLLAVSRQQVIEPQILCPNQLFEKTRNLLDHLIGENIELKLQFKPDLGNVKIDPAHLQQVFFNLVLNARDAISASGYITVQTRNCVFAPQPSSPSATIEGVMIEVSDTGCGITPEVRAHLFEPFFTTKAAGRGNGLGLATIHSIVRSLGGVIQVESEPGKGSHFRVMLPRALDAKRAPAEAQFSPVPAHESILLVEDNPTVRRAAKKILVECAYQVFEAGNGSEALAIARKKTGAIDLVLADIVMPGMSGRELSQQLLEQDPHISILYMSGYEPQDSASGDPTVCFRKPFTGAALLEKVRETLDSAASKISNERNKRKREKP